MGVFMESQILFELIMEIANVYPVFGDVVFWFGITWLILCVVLNVIDLLAGIFKWNMNNKAIRVLRALCERLGPSLTMFGAWAKKRTKHRGSFDDQNRR